MSNLGFYQTITTWAGKVGGPKILTGMVAVGGYIVLRFGEAGIKKGAKAIQSKFFSSTITSEDESVIYEVIVDGEDDNGLIFCAGDNYKILGLDGDAILIEKLGDSNNPYYTSRSFLISVSDSKAKEFLM